jgi:hypothetical protein
MRYMACGSEDKQVYMYDLGTSTYVQRLAGKLCTLGSWLSSPLLLLLTDKSI